MVHHEDTYQQTNAFRDQGVVGLSPTSYKSVRVAQLREHLDMQISVLNKFS